MGKVEQGRVLIFIELKGRERSKRGRYVTCMNEVVVF